MFTSATRIANPSQKLLSDRATGGSSSAIRDLLSQARQPGMISLAGGLPDSSLFPAGQLAEISHRVIADQGPDVLQYGDTAGNTVLRERFAASLPGAAYEDVVITTGSQQALDLLARSIIDPGDCIVVGDPEYLGALQVFRDYRAQLEPIPIDDQGLDTELLERRLLDGLAPKACYIVPNFHNPTGSSMTISRRKRLAFLADRYGFLIIEDDPYRELSFGDESPDPIVGDPDLHVHLRSVSKTLAPGLRVGAMAAPRWLVEPVIVAKQASDLHTSTLTQAIAAEALGSSWYGRHTGEVRSVYERKCDTLIRSLKSALGSDVSVAKPGGGMFLWLNLGVGDSTVLLTAALEHSVCFVPGAAFSVSRDFSSWVRLSFATCTSEQLIEGAKRLANLLHEVSCATRMQV